MLVDGEGLVSCETGCQNGLGHCFYLILFMLDIGGEFQAVLLGRLVVFVGFPGIGMFTVVGKHASTWAEHIIKESVDISADTRTGDDGGYHSGVVGSRHDRHAPSVLFRLRSKRVECPIDFPFFRTSGYQYIVYRVFTEFGPDGVGLRPDVTDDFLDSGGIRQAPGHLDVGVEFHPFLFQR